jgi:hypothetical protein
MWRRVDLVWTDVSLERIASIFRVEPVFNWWLSLQPPAHAGSSKYIELNLNEKFLICVHSYETIIFLDGKLDE